MQPGALLDRPRLGFHRLTKPKPAVLLANSTRLHRDGAIASKAAHDPDAVFYARLLRDFGATYTGRERVKAQESHATRSWPATGPEPPESQDRGMTRAGQIRALEEAETQECESVVNTPAEARRIVGRTGQASQGRGQSSRSARENRSYPILALGFWSKNDGSRNDFEHLQKRFRRRWKSFLAQKGADPASASTIDCQVDKIESSALFTYGASLIMPSCRFWTRSKPAPVHTLRLCYRITSTADRKFACSVDFLRNDDDIPELTTFLNKSATGDTAPKRMSRRIVSKAVFIMRVSLFAEPQKARIFMNIV